MRESLIKTRRNLAAFATTRTSSAINMDTTMSTTRLRLIFAAIAVLTFAAITASSFSLEEHRRAERRPPPRDADDKKLFPFQEAGVDRLVSDRRILLADEMGLGKTVQAVAGLNRLYDTGEISPSCARVLVVCPKSVVQVWVDELGRWLDNRHVDVDECLHVISAGSCKKNNVGPLDVESSRGTIQIVNYDICHKHGDALREEAFDVLICDEAHYLKSATSRRTGAVLGLGLDGDGDDNDGGIQSEFLWMLTGTPILNRPVELYPLLRAIDGYEWPSYRDFGDRFCRSNDGAARFGNEYYGASNLGELQRRLEPYMVRRHKSDVMMDLPPKLHRVVTLDLTDATAQEREKIDDMMGVGSFNLATFGADASSLDDYGIHSSRFQDKALLGEFATSRRLTSSLKLDPAVQMLREYIPYEKVVVFAHHRELILDLVDEFGDESAHIIGGMDGEARAEAVRRFQTDDACRIFVGSVRAAGVGVTLTAASHVVFLELDWSPAVMAQAEDRCHRIGQRDSVRVDYCVFKGSIDEWVARQLVYKTQKISNALPDEVGAEVSSPNNCRSGGGYKLDFGKHEGLRVEDLPRDYLNFIVEKDGGNIWRNKPRLWDALFRCGLVDEEPPPFQDPGSDVESEGGQSLEGCEVLYVFDFGKHTGKQWSNAPKSYRAWVLDKQVWKNRTCLWKALFDASVVKDEPPSIEDGRIELGEDPHVDYTFDFGKHVGKQWKDVPKNYKEWVLSDGAYNSRPDLRTALVSAKLIE